MQGVLAYLRLVGEFYRRYGQGVRCYAQLVGGYQHLAEHAINLQRTAREQAENLEGMRLAVAADLVEPMRRGMIHAVLGDLEEAEVLYQKTLVTHGQDAELQHSYGFFLANFAGRYEEALPHFMAASELRPTAEYYLSVARCLYRVGNEGAACEFIRAAAGAEDFNTLDPDERTWILDIVDESPDLEAEVN